MQLPTAFIQGQRFELLLRKLTIQASKVRDFDKLPIPFRAIATDIATGEQVVLGKGDLSVAIRASIAVPGAFDAVKINGRLLSDGGLVNNLPVNVVREMGADIIIAIDISKPLHKQDELNNAFIFAEQVTGLLTRREAEMQILSLSDRDILIIPELGNLTSSDFERYDEAISAGIKAATKQLAQLKPLTMSPTDYAKHMSTHNTDYFQLPIIDFSPLTHLLLDGTWASGCVIEGTGSFRSSIVLKSGDGSIKETTYSDTTCTAVSMDPPAKTFTYTFGTTFDADGSVDGITRVTEIDLTDTTTGASPAGAKSYNIYAISSSSKLYIGDETGTNDGTTAAKRPTKLTNIAFTKK